jgi:hypothetical protein
VWCVGLDLSRQNESISNRAVWKRYWVIGIRHK